MIANEDLMGSSGEVQQISFDGRQGRAKLLIYWLSELSFAQAGGDYNKWLQCLNSLHTLCMAYVDEVKRVSVKKDIKSADTLVGLYVKSQKVKREYVVLSLEKATSSVLLTYKDQFMTTTSAEEGDFDPTKFDGD